MIMKILVMIKNCLTYVIIQFNKKIMMIQTNDSQAGCIAIEDLVGLKTKMDLFLVEDSEHIKVNGVNENAVAKICHSKCKDVLLNKKCFRHSMNKMQSKNYK